MIVPSWPYRLLRRLIDPAELIARTAQREPDFIVWFDKAASLPYLSRWWLLPRNPLLNVYLHHIERSDDDRALHDHPWPNLTIVLRGSYVEILPRDQAQIPAWDFAGSVRTTERRAGSAVFRRAHWRHRLVVPTGKAGAWTLFITGPVLRSWGFYCKHGRVHWRDFTDSRDKGAVGRGCA